MGWMSLRFRPWALVLLGIFLLFGCTGNEGDSSKNKIDLHLDDNGDGVADKLKESVDKVLDLAAQHGERDEVDPEEEKVVIAAIEELNDRLPYSDETLTLQEEITNLYREMASVDGDEEKITELSAQIQEKQMALQADVNHQAVMGMLTEILEEVSPHRRWADPAWRIICSARLRDPVMICCDPATLCSV